MYKSFTAGFKNEPFDKLVLDTLIDNNLKLNITTPLVDQSVLSYNQLTQSWINQTLTANFLSDFNIQLPTTGSVLIYNGSQWVNSVYLNANRISSGGVTNTQFDRLYSATD
jgi:hypothetical protein